MIEIDLVQLQRQLEERAAANWDPEEAALLSQPPPSRIPAPSVEPDLAQLQREAEVRSAAFWDPDEVPLMEDDGSGPRHVSNAMIDAIVNAEKDFGGRRVTPYIEGSYADYLKTEHWLTLRRTMLARAGRLCRRCRKTSLRLEIYHLNYRHLGAEREADLIALCPECHVLEHGRTA